jgi:DNA modification methylase
MRLGLETVPCIRLDHLSEVEKKAYIIADNKLALNAGWDEELLSLELKGLEEDGFDTSLIGFDEKEMAQILSEGSKDGLTDEDEIPEVKEEAQTNEGDLYQLGNHKLLCGDSTSVEQVERLMGGEKADMVFTSPPYNANSKAPQGDVFNKKKSVPMYANGCSDNWDSKDYVKFTSSVLDICFTVTDGFIFWNINYNSNSRFEYIEQIQRRLPYLVEQICWKKNSSIPFKGSLMREWEPIYVFSTNKQSIAVKQVSSNFWQVSNTNSQAKNHKACFPVELPEKGINIVSKNTGIVLDPFGGSGSTLIACEKANRRCYMMEKDPIYCDVIVKRWEDFTGSKAKLID